MREEERKRRIEKERQLEIERKQKEEAIRLEKLVFNIFKVHTQILMFFIYLEKDRNYELNVSVLKKKRPSYCV